MNSVSFDTSKPAIATGLGVFSKQKFDGLLLIRDLTLSTIREVLRAEGHSEVTTSSLVNIAGSCENPYASFTLNYYGREAHLSQSAQLQLEAIVMRLRRPVFTVNNSFREENYDDPHTSGRRLSEFTLVESEKPYPDLTPEDALLRIIALEEKVVKAVTKQVVTQLASEVAELGGSEHVAYLEGAADCEYASITYRDALKVLSKQGLQYDYGHDLDIADERALLSHFNNKPFFITEFPASIKFFNMKKTPDGVGTYSVDLITPKLGETTGGAVREDNGELIKEALLGSNIAKYINENNGDTIAQFQEYMNLFDQEDPLLRGGFGIGFERLIGFLLNSNDILNTIAHRSMQPVRND